MSLKHYQILLLDDDEQLLTTCAQALGQHFTVVDGRDIWALESRRLDATMDAALLRFSAEDQSTRRFEEAIRTWGRQLPLFAVCQNEADGAQAIQLGALDFCLIEDLYSSGSTAQRLAQKIFISGIRYFQLERQLMAFMHRGSVEQISSHQILAANSIPLLIVDQGGVIRYLNTAAQLAYGAGADTLFDTTFPYALNSPRLLNITFGKGYFNINIRPIAWQGEPAYLCSFIPLQPSTDSGLASVEAGINRIFSAHISLASTLINLEAGVFLTAPVNGMQRIIFANAKMGAIYGFAVDDLIGRELDFFYGANTDTRMVEQLQVAAADGGSFHSVLLSYRQDATPFWNELSLTPTYNAEGHFTHFVGLTTDVTEKVVAAEQLHYRRQIEQLVTTISSEFVNLPSEQIDGAIVDAMARISTFVLAERSTLSQVDWAQHKMIATHQWSAVQVPRRQALEDSRSIDDLMWWFDQLLVLGALQMTNINQLPSELQHLRESVNEQQVQSLLTVPLIRGNKVMAVLSFETITKEHTWSDADIGLLKLVGEIFMRVLDRKATEQALRTSEERFRIVMDNTPILMFGFDTMGALTFVEGSALQTFGASAASLVGVSVFDAYADSPEVIDNVRRTLAGEVRQALIRPTDTPNIAFETWYIPLHGADGSVQGGVGVALNVSERVHAQQAEQKQRALAEALRDTASALLHSLDTDVLMDEILNNVHKIVPHDSASIVLRHPRGRQSFFTRGQAKSYEESFLIRLVKSDFIPTQLEMNRTGEPLLIPDTHNYLGWLTVSNSPNWIRSYLGAPIIAFGEVIGYLNLDSAIPGYFTQEHLEGLRIFANQAAIAIQNSQLYDQVKQDADRLNQLNRTSAFLATSLIDAGDMNTLSQAIADAVTQEYGRVDCNLILIDSNHQATLATRANQYQVTSWAAWVDTPSDPIAVVFNERTSHYFSSVDLQPSPPNEPHDDSAAILNGAYARLLLPLLTPNGCIGVLDIYSFLKEGFDQSDRNMLKMFAERAAVAIENMRLYQEMQHYNVQLEAAVAERTVALEHEQAQLRTILNAMEEAVIYWEADGLAMRVRYVNQAFSALTGYPQAEIINAPNFYTNLILEPRERAQFLGLTGEKSGASNLRFETKLRRQDGSAFDAVVTSTRLAPSASGPAKIRGVALFRDVSQEKLLQEQKDRFIAHASHEMRTPLTNVKLRLYLLKIQPEKADEHIKVLEQVSARMQELVENLLDVSRFERGIMRLKRSSTELQQVIKDVVVMQRPHADEKSIVLDLTLPSATYRAEVDPDRLAQVVTNLVINAINYTPRGGRMEVALEQLSSNEMAIRVTDSGIGMSAETLSHVFTPFFRASEGVSRGTGLGLTISLEIVKLHGGRIEVTSQEGDGTTFLVILPITQNGLSS